MKNLIEGVQHTDTSQPMFNTNFMNSNPDSLYAPARDSIIRTQSASTACLQRQLKIGYRQAEELMMQFENDLVSSRGSDGHRHILPRLLTFTHKNHPRNTYWVYPGMLMGGEYPGKKDQVFTERRIEHLFEAGVTAFLDLTERGELPTYFDDLTSVARSRETNFAYVRIPTPKEFTPESTIQLSRILNQIDDWMDEKRTTYVHCSDGIGRSGSALTCHMVHFGMGSVSAREQMNVLLSLMRTAD